MSLQATEHLANIIFSYPLTWVLPKAYRKPANLGAIEANLRDIWTNCRAIWA